MDDRISLAHGNGGRLMRELLEELFFAILPGSDLSQGLDAAPLPFPLERAMMTTDGFTVQPLEFPGGNLGSLAAHGVINDLAVAGGDPKALTLSAILEEGLEFSVLERVVHAFAQAVSDAGAIVVAGDTKVVPRGHGGGIYFSVAGLGTQKRSGLGFSSIKPGDAIVVSGPIGDHGTAVMLAREDFSLQGEIRSDCGTVLELCRIAREIEPLRFMRDPTRGGLATVMHEVALATGHGIHLKAAEVPIRQETQGVCDILGFDPLYLACEGRVVAIIDASASLALADAWRGHPAGQGAAVVGRVTSDHCDVILETELGGRKVLEELEDDPLPRIC